MEIKKQQKKRVLLVFGTRPEAIKMAPLALELKKQSDLIEPLICVTAQHREMLDQVMSSFGLTADFDLDVMSPGQSLGGLTSKLIAQVDNVIKSSRPDIILVHGDTTTTLAGALAGFYNGCLVGHVEAGLRTRNMKSPFPEEMNRQVVSRLADYHYAPTEQAEFNLSADGVASQKIFKTGNTVIDALHSMLQAINCAADRKREIEAELFNTLSFDFTKSRFVLVTAHRRENHGRGIVDIANALHELAIQNTDLKFVFPVHLNPEIRRPVYQLLHNIKNICLCEPLGYELFTYLMSKSYIVMTDSGGMQEEAPSLGKPVLVMRDTTERPEAVDAGTVRLIGVKPDRIVQEVNRLLLDTEIYTKMSQAINPYGDGKASKRITDHILRISI